MHASQQELSIPKSGMRRKNSEADEREKYIVDGDGRKEEETESEANSSDNQLILIVLTRINAVA